MPAMWFLSGAADVKGPTVQMILHLPPQLIQILLSDGNPKP
jgi:hypothetical protein